MIGGLWLTGFARLEMIEPLLLPSQKRTLSFFARETGHPVDCIL